jgi:hypothetical protein
MDIGFIKIDAFGIKALSSKPMAVKILKMAVVVAGGGQKIPKAKQLERLFEPYNIKTQESFVICGAKVIETENEIHICRALPDHRQKEQDSIIFDGRFEHKGSDNTTLGFLKDIKPQLKMKYFEDADLKSIKSLPAYVRPTLCVINYATKHRHEDHEEGTHTVSKINTQETYLAHKPLRECDYRLGYVRSWVHWRLCATLWQIKDEASTVVMNL